MAKKEEFTGDMLADYINKKFGKKIAKDECCDCDVRLVFKKGNVSIDSALTCGDNVYPYIWASHEIKNGKKTGKVVLTTARTPDSKSRENNAGLYLDNADKGRAAKYKYCHDAAVDAFDEVYEIMNWEVSTDVIDHTVDALRKFFA